MNLLLFKSMVIIWLLAAFNTHLQSQVISHPNQAMKSHETLEIADIEFVQGKTMVNLIVENRIQGGNFCADKNIYITDPAGKRLKILKALKIPVCPATYNFKSIGEKLDFVLEFPMLDPGTEWIDIVEECNDNCFWFYGVTLDPELNKRLDDAFASAVKGKPEENILPFRKILEEIDSRNLGIEGLLYINIINTAMESGDKVEASVWYNRLLSSGAPRAEYYVKYLNDRGIKY